MGFVNKVMLMGNTTRDPQLRQLATGTAVCDFGLATNRIFKTPTGEERQETVFVDCTAFGRTAEVIAEYCPKGRPLFIEGRLHFESWEDAAGNRRSRLTVIVENFQFTGTRESNQAAPAPTLYPDVEPARSKTAPVTSAPKASHLRAKPATPAKAPHPPRAPRPAEPAREPVGAAAKSSSATEVEESQDVDLPF